MLRGSFETPGIPPELVCCGWIVFDPNGRPLRLNEELANSADPEAVVGSFCIAVDFDGIFVDDLLVAFRSTLLVIHIPPEELEERIQELLAKLRLVVGTAPILLGISLEALNQVVQVLRYLAQASCRSTGLTQPLLRRVAATAGASHFV